MGCPLLEEKTCAFRLDKGGFVMLGKSSLGKKKKYKEETCMLMQSSQRVVFLATFVVCFGHSTSEPPSHVLGFLSFYEACCRHYVPSAGKAENASYLLHPPPPATHTHLGSLAAGVQAHDLDSRDNCPTHQGRRPPQGCLPGRGSGCREIAFLGKQ